MKSIMQLTCLALFCVGAALIGYEITSHFGSAIILFVAAFSFAVASSALFCAPEGYEQADGFHVRAHRGPRGRVGRLRLWQRLVRREFT